MKLSRLFVVAAVLVTPVAHAQINQIFGALHTAEYAVTEAKQLLPQQPAQSTSQASQAVGTTQAQSQDQPDAFRAAQAQKAQDGRERARRMVAEQDAEDIRKYKESQKRDAQQAQQQVDAANRIAAMCPDLTNAKYNRVEQFIRCRNKGMSEEQEMTFVGGFPLLAQAYLSSMVQDVFEDDITDPARGKAITDYYLGCAQRGTPCARRKW